MGSIVGDFLTLILDIVFWIIIIQVIMSWLIAFNVVNINNANAKQFVELLHKVTDPLYRPLRKFIPAIGGIDITPIIIIFAISILKNLVQQL